MLHLCKSVVRFPGASSDAGLAGYSPLELDEYIFRPIKPNITSVVTLREGGVSAKAEACQKTGLGETGRTKGATRDG